MTLINYCHLKWENKCEAFLSPHTNIFLIKCVRPMIAQLSEIKIKLIIYL